MKTIKKAQKGAKTKKTDLNTTIQKAKLDNKYNRIYAAMKKDSTDFSNKVTLPNVYKQIRKETGKSPSAEKLRSATDQLNKAVVKDSKKDKGIRKSFGKLDAKGRADNAMKNFKTGGSLGMKSVKAGYDNNPGITRADIITAATKKAQDGKTLPIKKSKAKGNPAFELEYQKFKHKQGMDRMKLDKIQKEKEGSYPKPYKAKKGTTVKKAQMGASVISKMAKKNQTSAPKVPKRLSTIKRPDDSMKSTTRTTMKSGGKMKKCRYGCK
jgi:hypothetical protein